MILKNIAEDIRALRDNGKFIEVGPGETVEVERPVFNDKVFEVVDNHIEKKNEKETKKREVK